MKQNDYLLRILKMTTITKQNFNSQLAGLVKSTTTQRDKLQAIIEFGFNHFSEHGDHTYLTMAMNAVRSVRAFRTATLKDYITYHVNVTWVKNKKDGKMMFKKVGDEVVLKPRECAWYEFNNKGEDKPDLDVFIRVKSLYRQLEKALEEGKVKEDQAEAAGKLMDDLKGYLQA